MNRPVTLAALTSPDPTRPDPMPVQIHRDLLAAIRDGRLPEGVRLPSSRAAAEGLGVSRATVNTAYDLLRSEGVLTIRPGAAPEVIAPRVLSTRPQPAAAPALSKRGRNLSTDPRAASYIVERGVMHPGAPAESLFPADEWAQALRRAARQRHGDLANYNAPFGLPALREVLAERLATDRGLWVDPEQILITTGAQGSLALVAQVMTDPGETVAMEDPGFMGARAAFLGAGLEIAPVPVDEHGLKPGLVPGDARLIYATPSNQYPLGHRLSLPRRLELLDRARAQDALVIEDDYDSEFLWRGREIAALAAHGESGGVVYLGTAAKVLMPALRIGWMVVPEALIGPMLAAHRNLGLMANLHAQLALAEMMRSGRYRAHLRRIARAYEARGNALTAALSDIKGIEVHAPDGGVQLTVRFRDGCDEVPVLTALAEAGFRPARLSAYCLAEPMYGLIVGFADATPDRIDRFAQVLGKALT
ncbi:PLP-dependent aminotransferase family protein [uncultured Roseibium sp.]|uniref:MocR-like pyridoxine biosynthesis transcription factor PdxR n=1 Tax=uncultured Roseibium sp. TaxID=1936171 RepID=UPI003217D619